MQSLEGKSLVVIGASRNVGRRVVEAGAAAGARVLGVARQPGPLFELTRDFRGVEVLALDATDEAAPAAVFDVMSPDVLVIGGGAFPPARPLHELSWREFAVNWEADVKIAFNFLKAALTRPLKPGSSVIVLSSGAAVAGSPISGGYAGAKRTQLFMTNYAQKEADRLGLGLRFAAVAPRIVTDTDLGRHAVKGYAGYLKVSEADFVGGMTGAPGAADVARAVLELAGDPERTRGGAFIVSAKGLEPAQ